MSSKLSLMAMGGKNYPTFDPPFFTKVDLKRYFSHNNRTYGPFDDQQSAADAYQALLLQTEGVR